MAIGINKTTDAGAAYLAMLGEEGPMAEQMAGIDYEALKQQYTINELVSYFTTNKDSLAQHDPKILSAVREYQKNMEPINEMGGSERIYLGRQMALRLLQKLGYGTDSSSKSQFLGAETVNTRDPYWKEFGKKGKK